MDDITPTTAITTYNNFANFPQAALVMISPGTENIYVALFQHSYLYFTYVHHLCNSYVHMYIVFDAICIYMSHMC